MKIVIATYMDWDAIYIDGICEKEDNTLYACDVVEVLENKLPALIESIEIKSVDEDWWTKGYEEGLDGYPKKIEDVVFEERNKE